MDKKKTNDYLDNVAYFFDSKNGDYVLIGGKLKLPISKCSKQAVISKIVEEMVLSSFDTIIDTAINISKSESPTTIFIHETDLPEIITMVDPRFVQMHLEEIKEQVSYSLDTTLEKTDFKYCILKSYCVNGTLDKVNFKEGQDSDSIDKAVHSLADTYFSVVENNINKAVNVPKEREL